MALDDGDAALAVELAERLLRQLDPENRLQRAAGLELFVRALIGLGEYARARAMLSELQELVAQVGTDPLRASALAAEGAVAAGEGDFETARLRYEDAVDLFQRIGAPFGTARARIDFARVLRALGRKEAATEQAHTAHGAMGAMRAEREAEGAAALLGELDAAEADTAASALTLREVEVLRLVAQGLSNPAIAERLVLSEHTVHRHLANILGKLDLPSRAAAAAWGARHGLV